MLSFHTQSRLLRTIHHLDAQSGAYTQETHHISARIAVLYALILGAVELKLLAQFLLDCFTCF